MGLNIRAFSSRALRGLRALGLVHDSSSSFTIRVSVREWGAGSGLLHLARA